MEGGAGFTSMWPHASTMNTISSSIADQIESNTCPICFELMRSPDFSPILLSPCGHTFCAKCVARHTSIHQKKVRSGGLLVGLAPPCPYCRQKISSQTLNLSLQKMIANILSLQQKLEKVEADKVGFCDGFLQAQTRCQILQSELDESARTKQQQPLMARLGFSKMSFSPVHLQCQHLYEAFLQTNVSKQRMEGEIADADDLLEHLQAKEDDIKDRIQMVSLEHQKVMKDLMDTHTKRAVLKRSHDDLVAKMGLIEASLSALEQISFHCIHMSNNVCLGKHHSKHHSKELLSRRKEASQFEVFSPAFVAKSIGEASPVKSPARRLARLL